MDYQNLIKQTLEAIKVPGVPIKVINQYYQNLGFYYYNIKNTTLALNFYLKVNPPDFSTYRSIAALYSEKNDNIKRIFYTEKCLELNYDLNIAYDLAIFYTSSCMFHEAYATYQTILSIDPKYTNAYNNQADILCHLMNHKTAIQNYEKALFLEPSRIDIYSNLLMTNYYIPSFSPTKRYEQSIKFESLLNVDPAEKLCIEKRVFGDKIKIGYLGYDFDKEKHPITCFVNHIFGRHTKRYDVYCYQVATGSSSVFHPKENDTLYTTNIPNVTTKNLSKLNDKEIAIEIYNDKIDILVELMHHTAGNRLKILSYRPAPIQMSYCAFPGTTGLNDIDFKIVDNEIYSKRIQDVSTEKLIAMPRGFHCYFPLYKIPEMGYIKHDTINLCCFNNTKKINPIMIELWIHLLRRIPSAHLYLRYAQYSSTYLVEFYKQQFINIAKKLYVNLDISRVHFIGYDANYNNILKLYHNMDIFLDTWPYNGTTVICEALNMAIPVVTLKGKGPQERMGASLLASIGRSQWIAKSREEYIDIAVNLCRDKISLLKIRVALKNKIKKTILGDPDIFIQDYEKLLADVIKNHN